MPETTNTGATLTKVNHIARLTVKYGAIAIVVMMVGRIFLTAFINYWKATHPPPPPPPTVGFGALPALNFPQQPSSAKPDSYKLETASGGTPNFGDRAKVYLMLKSSPSLLADERARQIAQAYDFIFEPETLGARTYRWTKAEPIPAQLELDIQSENFEFTTDYLSRPELLSNADLPSDFQAVERAKDFLQASKLLPSDMATASGEVVYLKALGGELSEAVSLSDADFIQVDLNRYPIDGVYRMFGPEGYKGSAHAVIGGAFRGLDSIMEFEYTYQPLDYLEVHTYPLRTSQAAWKILQSGEGYIADQGDLDEATIREVELAYFEDSEEQAYLQPIYVFKGDGGFLGYVSALDPKYIVANQ